jgi:hypothetical protein
MLGQQETRHIALGLLLYLPLLELNPDCRYHIGPQFVLFW